AGMLADPALPPGAPRPARAGRLEGARLSRRRPRRRTDAQDQLRAGRLRPGVPRAAPRRRARCASPGVALGPTRAGFSPRLIGWFCRLATRVSFQVASDLGGMFLGAAPPASTIEEWVLGLARPAYVYLSDGPLPGGEGDVLVIEIDGKAVPTATQQELARRRGPRAHHRASCQCQRHRGRARRRRRGRKGRRKKGDKSKNGRSATLVVMYTLRRGEGGRLHGPLNKKVFGTFGSRKSALGWARAQAARRGFPPGTARTIQIVVDGETCLERRLRRRLRGAILALDICHAGGRLWGGGRRRP